MRHIHKQSLLLAVMTAVLLLAMAVRVHHLGGQSFWYDEGVAYGHSQRTFIELIPALQNNVHVPAYFGSLALWEDFVGSSEFALRFYSVLWSLISVAVTYALGKRLFHPVAGVAAAVFVALNTFSIYYAQETRMYAMLAAVGGLSMWVFVGWLRQMRRQPVNALTWQKLLSGGLALALLNTVGAYTHYSYALVMLVQGMLALLWLVALLRDSGFTGRFWRGFSAYTLANLLTMALFAPWLMTAISQVSAQPNISDVVPLAEMIRTLQGWFAFGLTYETTIGGMNGIIYFLLIFALLIFPRHDDHTWWRIALPVAWVLLSCGVYLSLGLYERYLRFLLPAQIGFALWMGRGIWILWDFRPRTESLLRYLPRVTSVIATLVLAIGLSRGLAPLYNGAAFQRDDYRGIAQTIEREGQPGDAIILSAPGLQEIFNYYYEGALPVYPLPAGEDIVADTEAVINAHDRIYAVIYGTAEQDPRGQVLDTLNQEAYPINAQWVGDVQLMRFASPAEFATMQQSNITFGDPDGEHITLLEYGLSDTTLSPNDALQVRFQWTTDAPLSQRYRVFLQLLNSDGQLVAQRDSEPGGGTALTTLWQPGDVITDNHALSIPADLSPGDYTLIAGLYDLSNPAARLPVTDDTTYAELATVTITP
jgi:hypothetical protein